MFKFLNQGLLGFIFWLNNFFNDYGITIIVFTFLLKIALAPIDFLAFLEELKLQRIRPKIQEIFKKYKNNFQKQAEVLNEVYKKENYNPLFTMFIQFLPLPLLFSVFFVLNSLVANKNLNLFFLQTIDLTQKNYYLVLAVAIFQLLMIFNLPPDQKKFGFFFFGLIIIFLAQFPALFNLYWLANLLLTFLERQFFRLYQIKFGIQSVPENNP